MLWIHESVSTIERTNIEKLKYKESRMKEERKREINMTSDETEMKKDSQIDGKLKTSFNSTANSIYTCCLHYVSLELSKWSATAIKSKTT